MKPKVELLDDIEQEYLLQQYQKREEQINQNYFIHPHYHCSCSICFIRMSENGIRKDLQLDSFYEFSDQSSIAKEDQQDESFMNQFKALRTIIDKKKPGVNETSDVKSKTIKDPVDFLSLCFKLISPGKEAKTLNLQIMDTLFFYQREPCLLVYNDKDKGLKIIREKSMLANTLELRNFMVNRRFQYDMELRTNTERQINENFNLMEFDQKSAEVRIIQKIKKEVQKISISSKEFALVAFRNGGHQIMTQLDIMLLMDKRKIDPIWDQILLIQAFPMDFKEVLSKLPTSSKTNKLSDKEKNLIKEKEIEMEKQKEKEKELEKEKQELQKKDIQEGNKEVQERLSTPQKKAWGEQKITFQGIDNQDEKKEDQIGQNSVKQEVGSKKRINENKGDMGKERNVNSPTDGKAMNKETQQMMKYCFIIILIQLDADDSRYRVIKYVKDQIQFYDLYQRALEEVCLINNSIYGTPNQLREYDRFMTTLKGQGIDVYLQYKVYEIVHFMEAFHKKKVKKIRVDFVKDDFGNYYMINCSQIKFYDITKIQWNDMILKEIQLINEMKREEVVKYLDNVQQQRNVDKKGKLNPYSDNMVQNHVSQRQKYISEAMAENTNFLHEKYTKKIEEAENELRDVGDKDKTDLIFKQLNPASKAKFSELIEMEKDVHEKHQLLKNFPVDHQRFMKLVRYQDQKNEMQLKKLEYTSKLKKSVTPVASLTIGKNLGKSLKCQTPMTQIKMYHSWKNDNQPKQYLIKTNQLKRTQKSMGQFLKEHFDKEGQDNPKKYFSKQEPDDGNRKVEFNIESMKY